MASPKRIVLITGANQGVGFETAKHLTQASAEYHVILGSRTASNGTSAVHALTEAGVKGSVSTVQLDVTDDASVDASAAHITAEFGRLDVLVNNAGQLPKQPAGRAALREVLAVNTVGAVSVTEAFLPLLKKSEAPRLVFVSSSAGSITHAADPGSPYYAAKANEYRASKAALNMLMVQYHKNLEGFKVFGADPGLVASNFMNAEAVRAKGAPGPEVGGATVAGTVTGERDADVGKVCGRYGVSPW